MSILADENMSERVVGLLRGSGHHVLWIRETGRGSADPSLLDVATAERRLLITYDKDCGDLLFRDGGSTPYGTLLLRIHGAVPPEPEDRASFVYPTVGLRDPWPPGL